MGMAINSEEQYREAIASFRKKVPMPKTDFEALEAQERERAFTVAQVTKLRVLDHVMKAVDTAIESGTTLEDFQDEIEESLWDSWGGDKPGRIENIFRTNVLGSYAAGRHAVNSSDAIREARPYWRFDDTQSDRECETCEACGGVTLPADDPWWETHHVPLHHQCECTITALSPDEADEEGVDDGGPDVEIEAEGFGAAPSDVAEDWGPSLDNLHPSLLEVARGLLK